jgi:hypothetical protein
MQSPSYGPLGIPWVPGRTDSQVRGSLKKKCTGFGAHQQLLKNAGEGEEAWFEFA